MEFLGTPIVECNASAKHSYFKLKIWWPLFPWVSPFCWPPRFAGHGWPLTFVGVLPRSLIGVPVLVPPRLDARFMGVPFFGVPFFGVPFFGVPFFGALFSAEASFADVVVDLLLPFAVFYLCQTLGYRSIPARKQG